MAHTAPHGECREILLRRGITYTYRIVLCVEITEHDVILHNIGSHDEVYG